jgi:hypothetical protein
MTYNSKIREIKSGGVSCKSDAGLYEGGDSSSAYVKFLSLYGSPQQIRAIFALLVEYGGIEVITDEEGDVFSISKQWKDSLRLKTFSLGYGKRHGLVFTEGLGKEIIIWTSPEEKARVLFSALSKRRIPFDREWLPEIEKLLLDEERLINLHGWGGFDGYVCNWNDDEICDLIAERILPSAIS